MSRQKRILIASSMNAGAEALSPVIKKLRKMEGVKAYVCSHKAALSSFKAMGVRPDVDLEEVSLEKCKRIFDSRNPTTILTGTQVQKEDGVLTFEQMLWQVAKKRKIKSIAVLDTWDTYSERFSDLDVSSPNKLTIKKDGRLVHLPTQIAVLDKYAMGEMEKEGFDPKILEITGSPYFEHVLTEAEKISPATRAQLLEKSVFSSFDKDGKTIVFMSDSIESFYSDIGFTEKSILQSFLRVVDEIAEQTGMKINVMVRPHPFRNQNAREAYECKTSHIKKAFHNPVTARGSDPENEYSMEELLHSVDLVVGTFNNPLITAKIMGKSVISYQPDVNEKYNFQYYLHEQDLVTKVTQENKLGQTIVDVLQGNIVQKTMEAAEGATDRIIRLLE